jgi:hypothetical protein
MDKLRSAIAALVLFSVFGSLSVAQAHGGGAAGGSASGGGSSRGSTGHGAATTSPTAGGATRAAPATGANSPSSSQNGVTAPATTGSKPEHSGAKMQNDMPGSNGMHHKAVMGPCHHPDNSYLTPTTQEPLAPKSSPDSCVD